MKNKKKFLILLSKIREKFDYLSHFNDELEFIYNGVCSIIGNLNNQTVCNEIISQEKYNKYIEQIESIFNQYKEFSPPLQLSIFRKMSIIDLRFVIINMKDMLYNLCEETGASCCNDVLSIILMNYYWENTITNKKYIKLLKFYNKFFIPISSKCISSRKNIRELLSITKVENPELPFAKSIDAKSKTLVEKVDGASIYFPFKNKIIQINGIFKKDPINITRHGGTFGYKCMLLNNDLSYINIPNDFKNKFIEQLSLRDFVVMNIREIIQLVKKSHEELLKYKKKTLSSLIKEFVKSTPEKQLKIITLFLISDSEDQFNAHIVFDLISNKSLVFQSKPYAQQIFNSLHWSIQKYFKVMLKNLENKKRQLESLTSDDIPYETRIVSLKASDSIKTKALTKLKEMSGTKENSNKARQYLDGLLRIPFGIYHEENVFRIHKEFKNKLENFITIIQCKIAEFEENNIYFSDDINDILKNVINYYHTHNESENKTNIYMNILEIKIKQLLPYASVPEMDFSNISDDILKKFSLSKENIYELNSEDSNNKSENEELNKEDELIKNIMKNNNYKIEFFQECKKKLEHYKNIKDMLIKNNSLTNNHIKIIKDKLIEVENELGINEYIDKNNRSEPAPTINLNVIDFINYFIKESISLIQEWLDSKKKKADYIGYIEKTLNNSVYSHDESKNQIKRIIGQWMNGQMKGQSFGLCGPPGVGKTSICKNGLAKCLVDENGKTRPFAFLGLGGASNGSVLEGHSYTYLGSTWGKIVDILIETKCMNPIIYVDELDKVSKTEHGKEIISILTHLTDPVQNKDFQDKYFTGIPIDLSRVLFVFSYNHADNIDRILRDRIQEINVKSLPKNDKIVISKKYVLPDILKTVGFSKDEIYISKAQIGNIIDDYTYESGVRKLNEILFDIVRELNLKKIMNEDIKFPMTITNEFIKNIMKNKPKVTFKKIANKPHIGIVNGLYATNSGVGGITIIEVMLTPSDKKFSIEKLTGLQGNVMKESMHCALTLAWNILPRDVLEKLRGDGTGKHQGIGLHIHCPEAGTPKDGPSAGCAIVLGMISRLCNIPIRNNVAMTGEISMSARCSQIGGLHAKLYGALRAGVNKVLIPYENKDDYDMIIAKENDVDLFSSTEISDNEDVSDPKYKEKIDVKKTIKDDLKVVFVKDVFEVLKHGLVKNNLKFNKIY